MIKEIEVTDPFDNTTTAFVVIENEDGSTTTMAKAIYDTLPSNSSIPQAGE